MRKIEFRSARNNNLIMIHMVYPDGGMRPIVQALLPDDGDWRADVEFYDGIVDIYKKRIRRYI